MGLGIRPLTKLSQEDAISLAELLLAKYAAHKEETRT
jgi:hypothetical protein